ncbi:sensor histidine kinase [Granulicella tundricola]|uniref:Signal transduction histidine kinase, LytS n=1 Tax=Granulicella tundricola (strain ATCC BAA-1859 / DSM 23138 / MP5ACTX9) TaxID=1198114 RepID=E8X7I9_GRATM|nr:histidine kinase [Granulicella tundricola]ADW71423.1 signal transduction histidine kinase, LytS [Granulicella tundricola MP5ACTX9]
MMKTSLKWSVVSVVFWTLVAAIFALPQLERSRDLHRIFLSAVAQWWSWGILVPGIVAVDRALPFAVQRIAPRFITLFALSPFVSILYGYVHAVLKAALGAGKWSGLTGTAVVSEAYMEMFWSMLVYCLIVGVWEAYRYHERFVSAELQMERLQRNFSEARLNSLRMQLDPHFLFNALNTVSSQVEREPKLARKMIEHLGDLLRLSLDSQGVQEISLAEELAFLDHYLAIQKIRFGDALKVEMQIAPEVKDALVPSLFIQPLVENAIRHGISKRARGGVILLSARRFEEALMIQVLDDGVGLPAGWSFDTHKGVGLSVTRERFAGLYPDDASHFDVRRRSEGGTEVSMSFPLHKREETDDSLIA